MSLKVLIVGAGIAGLGTAIAVRRAGHRAIVFDRSAMDGEVGAAIHVPPNVSRFLVRWGLDPAAEGFVKATGLEYRDPATMELIMSHSHAGMENMYGGAALWLAHRVDLHSALRKMATQDAGPGVKAELRINSEVVQYDPKDPSITLASGEVVRGDLVVGADGIQSLAARVVLGRDRRPVAPAHQNCCYRFLIPAETLEKDPETSFLNKDCDGKALLIPDNEGQKRLITYPCRSNTIHNLVGICHDKRMENMSQEDYHADAAKSDLLETFKDYHPKILAVIKKATEVKRWPLLYRAPIPTWHVDKLLLAGDAAHPMLPHQGQGGAQGMEDGLVLGMLLCGATMREDVDETITLYEDIRRGRASVIQILSNVGQDQVHLVKKELLQFVPDTDHLDTPAKQFVYAYGYDAVKETLDTLQRRKPTFRLTPNFFQG